MNGQQTDKEEVEWWSNVLSDVAVIRQHVWLSAALSLWPGAYKRITVELIFIPTALPLLWYYWIVCIHSSTNETYRHQYLCFVTVLHWLFKLGKAHSSIVTKCVVKSSRGDITNVASIERGLWKLAVTCCRTSLNKSQHSTSLFLIKRSCLCLLFVVSLFIQHGQEKLQALWRRQIPVQGNTLKGLYEGSLQRISN